MGSDNLFHKPKVKTATSFSKRKAKRAAYDKVLIVCEGSKTELNYFNELIDFYKINSANGAIDGSSDSSPEHVFGRAVDLYRIEQRKGDPFDRVYCVFDKDTHESYEAIIKQIALQRPKGTFQAAVSVPCFECWLLLHFKYTTKPYAPTGALSIAGGCLKRLRKSCLIMLKVTKAYFLLYLTSLSLPNRMPFVH